MVIAVYCSANENISSTYKRLGDDLGKWIAEQGYTLLYGGATGGLMTRVSDAAKAAGGHVMGVVPQRIIASGRLASNCDELYKVDGMSQRKQMMRDKADAFVCLPGSYGTLDEMMDVIASGTVGEHHKPIYILNYKGFYDDLRREIARMKELCFIPQEEAYKPIFINTLEELYECLQAKKQSV